MFAYNRQRDRGYICAGCYGCGCSGKRKTATIELASKVEVEIESTALGCSVSSKKYDGESWPGEDHVFRWALKVEINKLDFNRVGFFSSRFAKSRQGGSIFLCSSSRNAMVPLAMDRHPRLSHSQTYRPIGVSPLCSIFIARGKQSFNVVASIQIRHIRRAKRDRSGPYTVQINCYTIVGSSNVHDRNVQV